MKLKTGKEEIVYLLEKVFEKYESETGEPVTRNTNRKNYESIARCLSEISNQLPYTADSLGHEAYSPDHNPKQLEYPLRKYDITSSQIKDAYFGIVANPRSFLIDSCYIYLYGVGRKGFEKNPIDQSLLFEGEEKTQTAVSANLKDEQRSLVAQLTSLQEENSTLQKRLGLTAKKERLKYGVALSLLLIGLAFVVWHWQGEKHQWEALKKDMNLLPYQPSQAEIDSLEGIWLCYTGSPQARSSDIRRYHLVVSNVLDIKYKNGYFTFNRYGASFDHVGYIQFEAPWLVSIHSYVNNNGSIESPRHSLMRLDKESSFLPVISASWNFDVGDRNNIIGIREVYIKQGKGGKITEVINTIENASCKCKIINWQHDNNAVNSFYLRNQLLDTLKYDNLKSLIDEKSIMLRMPEEGLILTADSLSQK